MDQAPADRRETVTSKATLSDALCCRCERLWLRGMRYVFRFDAWHASAPYSCRTYKRKVVDLANSLSPQTIVEVGCGLGDIVSRVKATERYGFDSDLHVIRAARFLHPGGVRWVHGDALSVAKLVPTDRTLDCVIMVNWTHNLSPEQLSAFILPLLTRVGHLILDSIDLDAPTSYRYRHDFSFLSAVTERVSLTRVRGEPRSFIVFKILR